MSALDFSEFNRFDDKLWKQQIQMDLKGKDYNQELIWESPEGIAVQPFYTKNKTKVSSIPDLPDTWTHTTQIYMGDKNVVQQLIQQKQEQGIRSFHLVCDEPFEPTEVLNYFNASGVQLILNCNFLNKTWLMELIEKARVAKIALYLNQDPLHHLAKTGNWPAHPDNVFKPLYEILTQNSDEGSYLGVHAILYAESGASNVQQLAYSMAQANETLEQLSGYGSLPKSLLLNFSFGIGPNYFFEIAKLRAMRRLCTLLGRIHDREIKCHITVLPAQRFMTVYDFNNNLLRHSSAMMAGILGGANALCNLPYDHHYKKSHEFSQSLAENQLFILESEVFQDIDARVTNGAYYIEQLTEKLAEQALALFKSIEASGGWLKAIKQGTLQRKIKEQHEKSVHALDSIDAVVVGINKYADSTQKMKDQLELYPFQKMNPQKTLVAPIVARRLTQKFELQRLNDEKKA
ncbi:MAG: methylmalonyl-CoA mutase family protein [Bacteroidetes bacterium]|nr:methylmalonyl-CoA mutase family protein [Bacteroidota bacterium]